MAWTKRDWMIEVKAKEIFDSAKVRDTERVHKLCGEIMMDIEEHAKPKGKHVRTAP